MGYFKPVTVWPTDPSPSSPLPPSGLMLKENSPRVHWSRRTDGSFLLVRDGLEATKASPKYENNHAVNKPSRKRPRKCHRPPEGADHHFRLELLLQASPRGRVVVCRAAVGRPISDQDRNRLRMWFGKTGFQIGLCQVLGL